MENIAARLEEFLSGTGRHILAALIVLFVGLLLIKIIDRASTNSLRKSKIERTTVSFVMAIVHFALYAILIYLVLSTLMPNLSAAIIAVLGSAALAVGLALKDSLADFAGGIMIIFNKPFKEGDFINVNGVDGIVKSIHLLYTELYSADNKKIVVNNSKINTNVVTNYSSRPTRRVDLEFSAAYGSDIDKVKEVLTEIALSHPKVLKTPAPLVRLCEHGESALKFRFRVWVNNADYWTVYYDVNETVYKRFAEEGIEIPFTNVTVHVKKEASDED
ncbi:MAG: mechanosensitive ion channel [Clostridia bacterium]|nr:mechanosensitive ion channel [Clostridia bacterium]